MPEEDGRKTGEGRRRGAPLPEGDDGETIVDMNVDGMPWYLRREERSSPAGEPMDESQFRAYRWAAVKAGLIIALIFGAVFAAFIAFCDFVWLK